MAEIGVLRIKLWMAKNSLEKIQHSKLKISSLIKNITILEQCNKKQINLFCR